MDKIATIQMIENVEHVTDSDFLDVVKVLGWQVVAKRDEFKIGDLCIFIPIDSILPDRPEFEFMRNKNFRIRSIKLRNCLSQGIIFPLSILESITGGKIIKENIEIGLDVTNIIGVTHYEKPIPTCLGGLVRGSFPSHLISKTDEERIQNIPRVIEELQGVEVYSTVKCDGTSATYINHNDDFQVCSRNNSMKLDGNNVYLTMAKKYDIMNVLRGLNLAIQGEICGPGIQKNRLGLKEVELFVFNVWDIERRRYFNGRELINICAMMSLKTVPFNCSFTFNHTIEQLLEMAKGLYPNTKNRREGIVIRPVEEIYSKTLKGRMSFKVLNNEYLLEHGE